MVFFQNARAVVARSARYAQLGQQRGVFQVKYKPKRETDCSKIPYQIRRTPSGNLPVYFEKGINYKWTLVRHVNGNANVLADELQQILSLRCRVADAVRGKIVRVPGNQETRVKEWLHHLGF